MGFKCSTVGRCWTLLVLLALMPGVAAAEEPAKQFVERLREAGYLDEALDYLDQADTNPVVPVEFRRTVDYERAVTWIMKAGVLRDRESRTRALDQAQQALDRFIERFPNHPLALSARRQHGNLLVERARLHLAEAKKGNRDSHLRQAASLLDQAYQIFTDTRDQLRSQLERIRPTLDPQRDSALIERRDQLRKDYLEAQILAAAVLEEKAETVPAGVPRSRKTCWPGGGRVPGDLREIPHPTRRPICAPLPGPLPEEVRGPEKSPDHPGPGTADSTGPTGSVPAVEDQGPDPGHGVLAG